MVLLSLEHRSRNPNAKKEEKKKKGGVWGGEGNIKR